MTFVNVCDFCTATPIVATYPCRDFYHRATDFDFASEGGWAACATCRDLIESGNRTELAYRSAISHPERVYVPILTLNRRIRGLHDTFWANREGPPVPDDGLSGDPTRNEEASS